LRGGCRARGFIAEGVNLAMADAPEEEGRMLADELGDHTLNSGMRCNV
jgi:hypothetical protein